MQGVCPSSRLKWALLPERFCSSTATLCLVNMDSYTLYTYVLVEHALTTIMSMTCVCVVYAPRCMCLPSKCLFDKKFFEFEIRSGSVFRLLYMCHTVCTYVIILGLLACTYKMYIFSKYDW